MARQTINDIQEEFLKAFSDINDWLMQYEFLLQIAAELEAFPEEKRIDRNLVRGCHSKLWIAYEVRDGCLHLWADSEALIVKGIIAVMVLMFQDQPLRDIAVADVRYIRDTNLVEQINSDRFQGINSAISSCTDLCGKVSGSDAGKR